MSLVPVCLKMRDAVHAWGLWLLKVQMSISASFLPVTAQTFGCPPTQASHIMVCNCNNGFPYHRKRIHAASDARAALNKYLIKSPPFHRSSSGLLFVVSCLQHRALRCDGGKWVRCLTALTTDPNKTWWNRGVRCRAPFSQPHLYSLRLRSLNLMILCSTVGGASCRDAEPVAARCPSYQSEAFNP
jgi:hypothetical protein